MLKTDYLKLALALSHGCGAATMLCAQLPVVELPPFTVTASRASSDLETSPFNTVVLDPGPGGGVPSLTADDFLRQVPGFSLFRRTPSVAANPTAQGASLRGIGPSGASRSLVLLDGVPFNDAFGGWVYWSQLNLREMERVEVVRGGGSAAWGNTALGGVIHFVPREPEPQVLETQVQLGTLDTRQASLYASERTGNFGISLGADYFSTDGYNRIKKSQRGSVDRPRNTTHRLANLVLQHEISDTMSVTLRGSIFDEERGNGTPLSENGTEAQRLHGKLEWREEAGAAWRADLYLWDNEYSSTFSSVNDDRSSEVLVLDQYSVPSQALGGSLQRTAEIAPEISLTVGTDLRRVSGETNEFVVFQGADRKAGGDQGLYGLFLEADGGNETLHWQLGLRGDYWVNEDGYLQQPNAERVSFSDREQAIFNGRLGASWQPDSDWQLRGAVYQAFRVPTINELYRPFRVGDDSTLANEELEPEQLVGVEGGLDFYPVEWINLSATVFYNQVEDPILNVTIGSTFQGGKLRQRRNIGRTEIAGLEIGADMALHPGLRLRMDYALTDAQVDAAPEQPGLVGKQLAQVARHVVTGGLVFQPEPTGYVFSLQARWNGSQYEDDLNTRRLNGFFVMDASAVYRFADNREVFLVLENAFDRRYPVGITGEDLLNIGPPRTIRGGISWAF